MVAIKNDMNIKEDIKEIDEKVKAYQALIDAGDANAATLQEQINEMNGRKGELEL